MKVVAALEKRVQDLEDRLGRNTRNSSLLPSANQSGVPKLLVKNPTGRKSGANRVIRSTRSIVSLLSR